MADSAISQFAPKAKSVIWYFMLGGTSHLESFDPKPAVDRYAGLTIDESPFKSAVLDSPFYRKNVRAYLESTSKKIQQRLQAAPPSKEKKKP